MMRLLPDRSLGILFGELSRPQRRNRSDRGGKNPMKAAFIEQYGGPEVLKYGDLPDPVAGPGEVVIDVVAASVTAPIGRFASVNINSRSFHLP
jgi:hypothetical protein